MSPPDGGLQDGAGRGLTLEDWATEIGEDSERYAYPPPLNDFGFFEGYFDGKPEAVATSLRVKNSRLSAELVLGTL